MGKSYTANTVTAWSPTCTSLFLFSLVIAVPGVHCDIYPSSYIIRVEFTPPTPFSFIPPWPHSWNTFNRSHLPICIHVYIKSLTLKGACTFLGYFYDQCFFSILSNTVHLRFPGDSVLRVGQGGPPGTGRWNLVFKGDSTHL
jgi:hypothetical protein